MFVMEEIRLCEFHRCTSKSPVGSHTDVKDRIPSCQSEESCVSILCDHELSACVETEVGNTTTY